MKVSELTGALLDYWVARAEGWTIKPAAPYAGMLYATPERPDEWRWLDMFQLSTSWAQGGPIIYRERIRLLPSLLDDTWRASYSRIGTPVKYELACDGPAPLVAAMRAYVASKYGDEVPDEAPT